MKSLRFILASVLLAKTAFASGETWEANLNRMPLGVGVTQLNWTNCAQVMLGSFQSNATVKALVFAPGATDELYFFHRVKVNLTNPAPSLLDAVSALTNQSPLRVEFRPPMLLIFSEEDVLDLDISVQHERTVEKLKTGKQIAHLSFIDRDWDQLVTVIKKDIGTTLLPYRGRVGSWHFYRHTFAGWNLTPWETLQATALAGKTKITVTRGAVTFDVDPRVGKLPKLERFPGR